MYTHQVVQEVLPDTREIDLARNSKLLQILLGANSRSKQDGRTAVGSAADDDFLLGVEGLLRSITAHNHNALCLEAVGTVTLKDNPVNRGFRLECDILRLPVLGDEIRAGCPDTLVNRSGCVTTAVRVFAMAEHVRVVRQSLRDHRVHDTLGDGSEVVRLDVQGTIISVALFIGLEPWLGMECLGLALLSAPWSIPFQGHKSDLSHVFEELLSAPSLQSPVIVVLLAPTNAKSAIASTAATKELSSAELDLAVVHTRHRRGNNVPVGLRVEILRPACPQVNTQEIREEGESSGFGRLC